MYIFIPSLSQLYSTLHAYCMIAQFSQDCMYDTPQRKWSNSNTQTVQLVLDILQRGRSKISWHNSGTYTVNICVKQGVSPESSSQLMNQQGPMLYPLLLNVSNVSVDLWTAPNFLTHRRSSHSQSPRIWGGWLVPLLNCQNHKWQTSGIVMYKDKEKTL